MARWCRTLALLAALALLVGACGRGGGGEGQDARWQQEIVIGWTPPDITGVFKTATEFFEKAAKDAAAAGFNVKVESRSPATHTAFADQVAIIDDFVWPGVLGSGEKVDVQPDQYLDLKWWEGVYQNADPASIRGSGSIIEGIAGTFFSQG